MALPSYRDRVRPAQVDASVLDTGDASAARALANTLKDFEQAGRATLGQLREEQGRREGAEAGRTDDPRFRTGMSSLTAYGRAYNDAATRSYAIKSEIAADEAATRIEQESGNDPEKFRVQFAARRDETIKAAPEAARAVLGEVYDRRMASGMQRLIVAQAEEQRKQDRADVSEGIVRATDRIAQLRASNDPALHAQAEEEQVKLDMLIDGAHADGTLSTTEAGALRYESAQSVLTQTVVQKFRAQFDDPYGDPVGFIENLRERNKTSEALPPDEEAKLLDTLLQELRERNSLAAAGKALEANELAERWRVGDNVATNLMLDGKLTVGTLSKMLDEDALDPSVARTLFNELQSGADRPDDSRERFRVETTLLEQEEDDIAKNSLLSWDTRRELIAKRRELAAGWRGTQQAREGADRIDRALGLVPGANPKTLSDEEIRSRDQALTEWYNAMDELPPAERQVAAIRVSGEIVERVIKRNARNEADGLQQALQSYKQKMGDPGELSDSARKKYEEKVASFENRIRAAEQKAK